MQPFSLLLVPLLAPLLSILLPGRVRTTCRAHDFKGGVVQTKIIGAAALPPPNRNFVAIVSNLPLEAKWLHQTAGSACASKAREGEAAGGRIT